MADTITKTYRELAAADKELSIAKQNYDDLQDELTELEFIKHAGSTTIENLQKDINTITHRLNNHEMTANKECLDLEENYGDLVPGNSLPDTLEEILSLSEEEKIKADQELRRIAGAHQEGDDYTLAGYAALKERRYNREQEIFEAQLKYGQLPETEEEIYALNEADPKDKQTIEVIMNLLNEKLGDERRDESRKTWEDTKKAYQNIKNDYTEIRRIQKEREAQIQNLLNADLNTLRQQQSMPASANENTELITEESKILINGELEKNADDLGIGSLDEYFKKEKELYAAKPDTRAIDDLPAVAHFFTDLGKMDVAEAEQARRLTNELIQKHQAAHPQTDGAANSVEDYENSQKMQADWENRRNRIAKDRTPQGLVPKNIVDELPEGEVRDKVNAYNQAQTEKARLEKELAEKSLDVFPVKVTDIKKLKEDNPLKFEVLSAKIKALAEDDSKKVISSLSEHSYDADTLIQEHSEMRALEEKNKDKTQRLTEEESLRLRGLQRRVREMKDRLEVDKKEHTNFFGRPVFSDAQIAEQNRLKSALEQNDAQIKTLEDNMVKLADAEAEKYAKESKNKKDYIKHTVVESAQKDAVEKKTAYEKKEEEHKKLTEKVDGVLNNLKKEQKKKQEEHEKALQRDEELSEEKNRDAYVKAASTKSMVEIIKNENKTRKGNEYGQRELDTITKTNTTTVDQLNADLDRISKNVKTWIKEDKELRTKNIESVNEKLTEELSDSVKTAGKKARKAGRSAKVMGFVSQKVGSFTDFYRKKIKEISDGMIKAPRLEKEAQVADLNRQIEEQRSALAAMERSNRVAEENSSRSAMDAVQEEQRLAHVSDDITEKTKQIAKLNQEIQAMKPAEEKRLQENAIKFNKIFGDVIPTDFEQMKEASELKRDAEIEAAKGDPKKIERANAAFELRKIELEAQFDKEELEDEQIKAEIDEINEKSEEWGRILNDSTKSKIDIIVTIGEKVVNFASKKTKEDNPINVRESLTEVKESLSSESEHVVDQLLEIGELVYQKLQGFNETLAAMYQEASYEHASQQNIHDALKDDNERFLDICKNDTENKMGVSLKDKRITYLNDMKERVKTQLEQELEDKEEAKTDVQNKVKNLDESSIPDKEKELSDASQEIDSKITTVENLEKQLGELRDDRLEQYRREKAASGMTDKAISESAEGIRIHTDPSQPVSGADLIGQLTGMRPDDNTKLEDVMEQIQKINVNGIGLINFVDPSNRYSNILSAGEAEQKAFKDEMLNTVGTVLKSQLGNQIVSVEQDDMMLHPVLMEGNEKFNKSAKSMVAGLNAVRLDSAKLNVMKKTSASALTEHDKQIQPTLDTAVKQSRSRVSLSSLMEKEKQEKGSPRRERQESGRTRERSKDADQTSRGKGIGL